jgi:hypothetical protein
MAFADPPRLAILPATASAATAPSAYIEPQTFIANLSVEDNTSEMGYLLFGPFADDSRWARTGTRASPTGMVPVGDYSP